MKGLFLDQFCGEHMPKIATAFIFITMMWIFPSQNTFAFDDVCSIDSGHVEPTTTIFEDKSGILTLDNIINKHSTEFYPLSKSNLMLHYSRSAYWLNIQIQNKNFFNCTRWLSVGSPRIENIQVYYINNGQWKELKAGPDFLLQQWSIATTQPIFPLELIGSSQISVFVRIAGDLSLVVKPELWSSGQFIESQQESNVFGGLVAGAVLVISLITIGVGLLTRSLLLLSQSLALLSYLIITALLNGYLIFLPGMLSSFRVILTSTMVVSFALTMMYLWFLLKVQYSTWYVKLCYYCIVALYFACNIWSLIVDSTQGRELSFLVLRLIYPVVALTVIVGIKKKIHLSWMAWVMIILLAIQFVLRYMLHLENTPWRTSQDIRGLFSIGPGTIILLLTLSLTIIETRKRHLKAEKLLAEQRLLEHNKLEDLVQIRTKQLQESLNERNVLLAHISHDLRSPLVAIIDSLTMLGTKENHSVLNSIKFHANYQLDLIKELVEFSKNNLKTIELNPSVEFFNAFCLQLEIEGKFLATRRKNHFSSQISQTLPTVVIADYTRLRQVVVNLLDNAAKYTEEGDILLSIECNYIDESCVEVKFSVKDSGPGISSDDTDKMMQPYTRGDNVQSTIGSGLGLSIVKQLLENMNSALHIEHNSEQRGITCWFDVQLMISDESQIESCINESHIPFLIDCDKYSLLIVDDAENSLENLYDFILGYGFNVVTAKNGLEACNILSKEKIDIIITDLKMPVMNGLSLLRYVKSSQPDIKIILLTAQPYESKLDLTGYYFDSVLLKPVGGDILLKTILKVISDANSYNVIH